MAYDLSAIDKNIPFMEKLYREIDASLVNSIKDKLIQSTESLSVAESVTGGVLQVCFTLTQNASMFFQGGITAYNIGQKARHLHIDAVHGMQINCVSEKVAAEMALNATRLFSSDWALAITGYDTPMPEKNITDLHACIAIANGANVLLNRTIGAKKEPALHVRYYYTNILLSDFAEILHI